MQYNRILLTVIRVLNDFGLGAVSPYSIISFL